MGKNEFIIMLEEYLENRSGELENYFEKQVRVIETKGAGGGCLMIILWCLPFLGFMMGDSSMTWFLICLVIAIVVSIIVKENTKDYEQPLDDRIYELIEQYNNDCETRMRTYLKKNKINKDDLKNVLFVKSNNFKFYKDFIQYSINNNEVLITCLPVENISFKMLLATTNSNQKIDETYLIKIWNVKKEIKPTIIEKSDINNFAYHGTEISSVDGQGGDLNLGGALIGGILFGGVGALLGGKNKVTVTSKTEDLREVQINTKDNKNIIVKGFHLYEDLICFFPDKGMTTSKLKIEKNDNTIKEKLKDLKDLLDERLITVEDFENRKNKLLEKM